MGLIPEEIISQVIDNSDIVDLISSYVPLKKSGRNFKACCPFHHEKTPSFIVNPDKQIFHCFGCGVGGNVVSFVMMQDKTDFPEAVRYLAKRANITVPKDKTKNSGEHHLRQKIFDLNELAVNYFQKNLLFDKTKDSKNARNYLKDRDVDLETVKEFKLGLSCDSWDGFLNYLRKKKVNTAIAEKSGLVIKRESGDGFYDRFRNRIMFPIFDTRGNCRAFGARILEDTGTKYINSPETPVYTKGHHLFGFHLAKRFITQDDFVIVVEGYMDCIMPYQAGVKNIVASLGTALTVEQIRLIRRYTKNVVMLYDMDDAGESAMIRSFDVLVDEGLDVKVASLSKGDDPDSFIRKSGLEEFKKRIKDAKSLFEYKFDNLLKRYDPKTSEGKAKISSELLPTIDKFNNAVIRSEYIRTLSQRLSISEQALITEIKKISTGNVKSFEKRSIRVNSFVDKQTRRVEKDILKLLLEEEQYIQITKDHVDLSDFQDKDIRRVMSKIFENFDMGKKMDVGSLINSFEDKDLQGMISSLVAEESRIEGDKDRMHKDYMRRIKEDKLKKHREEILAEIIAAESSGDEDMLEKLKQEFNELVKK